MVVQPINTQYLGTRTEQQDDFGFSDHLDGDFVEHGGILAIVTDGMGGLARGREASRLAKQTMLQAYEGKSPEEPVAEALGRALESANKAVNEFARQHGQEEEIGTTLVAGVVHERRLYWVSAGDSRMYLFRRGRLRQLSRDHDYAKDLEREVAMGRIAPEEASSHPLRKALTSYLGLESIPRVNRNRKGLPLKEGDLILLCSDGLYNALTKNEMVELLNGDPQEAAGAMIATIKEKQNHSQDNVTLIMLDCQSDGENQLSRFVSKNVWLTLGILLVVIALGTGAYLGASYFRQLGPASSAATPTQVQQSDSGALQEPQISEEPHRPAPRKLKARRPNFKDQGVPKANAETN